MTQRSRLGSRAPVVAAGARVRAVIDALLPAIDGGRFAVKCIAGEAFYLLASRQISSTFVNGCSCI